MGFLLLQDKIKVWNWNQIFVVRKNLDTAMTERQRSRQHGPAGANQPAGLGWAADLARTSRAQEEKEHESPDLGWGLSKGA